MKVQFKRTFGWLITMFLVVAAGSLWAVAQTSTNNSGMRTNESSSLAKRAELVESHYLTFGLDRIEPLHNYSLLGQPLWKYPASLIYILLAFYVSKLIDFVTRVWLKKMTERTQTKVDDLLLELLSRSQHTIF